MLIYLRLMLKIICILGLLPAAVFAQGDSTVVKLYQNGAPGFKNRRNEPEKGTSTVSNIHNPSITVFLPPKEQATGAAVVICPGGGHVRLVVKSEGYAPAKFFTNMGVAAIVLKYRLGRDTLSPYKIEEHARQDGNRAMRLVREHAAEWNIDPNRIGMMGFSAGGEVVNMVAYENATPGPKLNDATDKLSSLPNFVIQVYPGPLFIPAKVAKTAPPAFLVVANDDACCSTPIINLLNAYREAGASVETHLYAKGNHAFNMGYRAKFLGLKSWPQQLTNWFIDNNYFKP
jgi:acetyl esterase/lipase